MRLNSKSDTGKLEVNVKEVNGESATKEVSVDLKLHKSHTGTLYWTFAIVGEENNPDASLFI